MDGQVRELKGVDPTRSVLQLLRYDLKRTGTKEGCAEGDCGACTVALGRLQGDEVVYEAVNACIQFAPVLDGKELVTVESLAEDGRLHPVQQAMVDRHGSQCGFCTPGFVMSLFAMHERGDGEEAPAPEDVLAGNLCRCTGYGPILAAAQDVLEGRARAQRRGTERVRDLLRSVQPTEPLSLDFHCPLTGAHKRWFSPRTVEELAGLIAEHPDAVILAGATDVGLWVTKQHWTLEAVIYLGEIGELKEVREEDNQIFIGAGARYGDAAAALAGVFPDFGEVIRRLGSAQIRNAGTIGGNIANGSPIGDSPPPLIVLGANLIMRAGDNRREIALEDFFLDYGRQDLRAGEFVEAIRVPKPAPGRILKAYKISKRFDQDISALLGAFCLDVADGTVREARIAFGGMAATPRRAPACEAALIGSPWNEQTVERAAAALAQDFSPISDLRASAHYRMQVAQNLLRKAYWETASQVAADEVRLVGAGAHG